MTTPAVGVEWEIQDLDRTRRAIGRFGKEAKREIKVANLEAAELVVRLAKARANRLGGVAAHVARDDLLNAKSTQRKAEVALGPGGRFSPAFGAEFGSKQFRQFGPWTGNDERAGRFLFPTIREDTREIVEVWTRLMLDLAERTVRNAATQ